MIQTEILYTSTLGKLKTTINCFLAIQKDSIDIIDIKIDYSFLFPTALIIYKIKKVDEI